jgi:four helix bundle protein
MNPAETQRGKAHDLQERTAQFGEAVIAFAKTIPHGPVTLPLITQLVRSGTSVGANYCEADNAETKKDFRHKIGICRKEARESQHWLRMSVAADARLRSEAKTLWQEAKELNLIFSAIFNKSKPK